VTCVFPDSSARERLRLEINEDLKQAEPSGHSSFWPVEAVQEFEEGVQVSTGYGIGHVLGFRPADGIYSVELLGWKAKVYVHMLNVRAHSPQRRSFMDAVLHRQRSPLAARSSPKASPKSSPSFSPKTSPASSPKTLSLSPLRKLCRMDFVPAANEVIAGKPLD